MARLQDYYRDVVRGELQKQFGYGNPMQIPKLDKIVLNMGVGEATQDSKKLQSAMAELALISGQKPAVCRARKSVANFKLREGMAIGCKVTLRSQPDVRVPRSPDQHRPAAGARLSRRVRPRASMAAAISRWGCGADHLSRDQLRRRRRDARARCGDLHDRAHRRGGDGRCSSSSACRLRAEERLHGQEECRGEEQPPAPAGGPRMPPGAPSCARSSGTARASRRSASRRRWRWPSCRATAPGRACATAAP